MDTLRKKKFYKIYLAAEKIFDCNKIHATGDIILALIEFQGVLAEYHRQILLKKSESKQTEYLPNTEDTARFLTILVNFDQRVQDLGIHLGIEFAPFMVCGRKKRHSNYLSNDIKPYRKLGGKNIVEFVNYAKHRKNRVLAIYLHARCDHANAIMFKPKACGSTFVGLHKFDPNGTSKSKQDKKIRALKFPEFKFYINHKGPQVKEDHTCTFWSIQYMLWKYLLLTRNAHSPLKYGNIVSRSVDSFRAKVFKCWVVEMIYLIHNKKHSAIHTDALIDLTNPKKLQVTINFWKINGFVPDLPGWK